MTLSHGAALDCLDDDHTWQLEILVMVSEHNNKNFSQLLLISLAQQSVQN
jgi:hypothetical protein